MGSTLSSLISDIFIQHLENQHLKNLQKQFNIIYYSRFVYDVIHIYYHVIDNSEEITYTFNKIHPNIQFTLEKESNSINFIDLKNFKTKNKFTCQIYTK